MLVARLARIWVELRARELVCDVVVHRDEKLAGLRDRCDNGGALHSRAAGDDGDASVRLYSQPRRVSRMNFNVRLSRIKHAQDGGLAGAGVRVPLRARAATG